MNNTDEIITENWEKISVSVLILQGLKGEQKLYGREILVTADTFNVITNSEEEIETVLIHNGYHSDRENQVCNILAFSFAIFWKKQLSLYEIICQIIWFFGGKKVFSIVFNCIKF